ncbi:uncharacterized protein MEPE_02844 [Melanopsichium pennsylvanicum]|uniref:Uncharacterized protein n=2 Tax=Melanopsichium pennsylvanicum TaxID=63383 RepID=A0AAJ5C4W7_9BASI|nr:conserved hypothetical protein [Melanopsichium pennsylvanicum 4]SNX84136.1 uncharacterized protein MEPE_02844 [Melanopsichium pennsylvanicum]
MQAESSQAPRVALAAGVVPSQSTSPYLAAAPAGLFAPPAHTVLFHPSHQAQSQHLQQQHQTPQPNSSPFLNPDAAFQHPGARNFQQLAQDPCSSSHEAAYRVSGIPRDPSVIDYTHPHQHQFDSHLSQQTHPSQYHPHHQLYASTSYSQPTGASGPVSSFAPDLTYAHPDLGMLPPNVGVPMMRYSSFPMSVDAGSSNGTPGPMTQQDIDNLLAMSRAQAGNYADASAFPCTYCDKVYTGKHARSIWRRHLQDKHNIPLSAQPRRTRWDGDVNRPKNAEERRARMLESKRRWARKKRLQEKQSAQAGKSGCSNTPMPEGSDDEDGDYGADADISNMDASFGEDSLSMPSAHAQRRASLKSDSWENSSFFAASQEELARPAKRQALAPSTSYNMAGPSNPTPTSQYPAQLPYSNAQEISYSNNSPMRPPGLTLHPVNHQQQGAGLPLLAGANDSFSSNSSDYSQPGSASFFNETFAGNMSNAGSDTANTSIDTPATIWPALPPVEDNKIATARGLEAEAAVEDQPKVQKGDTRDAAIQLLALRSGSNSPTDDRETKLKRMESDQDAPWSSTPSRAKPQSEHAALVALSNGGDAMKKCNTGADLGLSPSPNSRTLSSSTHAGVPITTPGPCCRSADNPFSLDKHKISPYEGRRKLSYSGAPASPIATSPTHLTFGGVGMSKSLSSTSSTSTGVSGVRLPPLVSTPIKPSPQTEAEMVGDRIKMDSLPPLLGSASKKLAAPIMSTPFSKPMSGLGFSALRRAGPSSTNSIALAGASSVRPSPSRRYSHEHNDQFSSPQHLNLTESLGLAPHSISRTNSYASASCYASSLGLTPSVAGISGGLMVGGTPFHSGLGALSGLGGFTPLSSAKTNGVGLGQFWPESSRKSASKSMMGVNSPTVYKAARASGGQSCAGGPGGSKRKLSSLSHTGAAKSRTASPVLGKGDIFDTNYHQNKSSVGPGSDDSFEDDDEENLIMSIGALDTPSRPAVLRKLARTQSGASQKLGVSNSPGRVNGERMGGVQRSPFRSIKLN